MEGGRGLGPRPRARRPPNRPHHRPIHHPTTNLRAQTVRETDGFQPHIVSPEAGLRRLVADALAQVERPVAACVHRIHQVLLDAARDAAGKASLLADSSTIDAAREPLRLPAFERAVVAAATRALERWREEALKGGGALGGGRILLGGAVA